MVFFTLFFSAQPTHMALLALSFIVPNLSPPPDIDKGEEEAEEEDEDEEEEEGGLAIDSMPWMASRVLGEAGASSLQNTNKQKKQLYFLSSSHFSQMYFTILSGCLNKCFWYTKLCWNVFLFTKQDLVVGGLSVKIRPW